VGDDEGVFVIGRKGVRVGRNVGVLPEVDETFIAIGRGLGERTGTPATVIHPREIRLNNPNNMCFGRMVALEEGYYHLISGAEASCRR